MVNYVFVAAGQCGNQLVYDLLNSLHLHSRPAQHVRSLTAVVDPYNPFIDENDDSSTLLYESLFRTQNSSSLSCPVARTVCLDTEPKVIEDCLSRSQSPRALWHYDPKSILYRHGGAGNNWALGYSMAAGEFLEKSLDCIRRELEHCDSETGLIFLHSLAGGTGSGLGTHITEACEDEFSSSNRANIVIAPHHFGEVVVQHYNALLCLSKIHHSSQGILLFENEIAQMLCKEMHGIEKPLLTDLNHIISSNLLTLFLPKILLSESSALVGETDNRVVGSGSSINRSKEPSSRSNKKLVEAHQEGNVFRHCVRRNLFDDISFLCSHPGYRFCQIRLTPQTSKKSIDYTYDSWTALLKAIQRMQLSGTLLERHVRYDIKSMLNRRDQAMEDNNTYSSPPMYAKTSPIEQGANEGMNRSLASIVSFHGEKSYPACGAIMDSQRNQGNSMVSGAHQIRENHSVAAHSKITARTRGTVSTAANDIHNLQMYEEFRDSHSDIWSSINLSPIQFQASPFLVNKYKRSTTVLSNDQTILPILQRTILKSQDMFEVGAYVHQYTTNGLEQADFYEAFQSVGATIHNYSNL